MIFSCAKDVGGDLYSAIGQKAGAGEPGWGVDRIYPERYAAINTVRAYLFSLDINQKPFPLSLAFILN